MYGTLKQLQPAVTDNEQQHTHSTPTAVQKALPAL